MEAELEKGTRSFNFPSEDPFTPLAPGPVIPGPEGRKKFKTTCPNCNGRITTEIVKSRNRDADIILNCRYCSACISLTIFAIIFGYYLARTMWLNANGPLTQNDIYQALGLFGVVAVLPLLCVVCSYCCYKDCYQDVRHFCPLCNASIGVSSGEYAWDKDDRINV